MKKFQVRFSHKETIWYERDFQVEGVETKEAAEKIVIAAFQYKLGNDYQLWKHDFFVNSQLGVKVLCVDGEYDLDTGEIINTTDEKNFCVDEACREVSEINSPADAKKKFSG